jgi:hypothetical protein
MLSMSAASNCSPSLSTYSPWRLTTFLIVLLSSGFASMVLLTATYTPESSSTEIANSSAE